MTKAMNGPADAPRISRRTIATGAAWAIPVVVGAVGAPMVAASIKDCLSNFRESSGNDYCVMGLWTNSNPGGATYPTTLQSKPLYDCRCGSLGYCTDADPATISNVQVQFLIPTCYTISPQDQWTNDGGGTAWTATTDTFVYNSVTYNLLTVSYASIAKYGSGQQIQVPLKSNCAGNDFTGQKIYSRMSAQCGTSGGTTSSTAWTVITNSGTSWSN